MSEDKRLKKGVWFQAAHTGLYYQSEKACGDAMCVIIDGVRFYPEPHPQPAVQADALCARIVAYDMQHDKCATCGSLIKTRTA